MDRKHAFRLQNDLSEVPPLRERFVQSCTDAGVADEDMQSSMLVFTELLNNAIEHGCKEADDHVEGSWRITPTDIEVVVTDPGCVLTAEDFSKSDPMDFAETGRGAGLFLIQALGDEVEVTPAQGGGTTVRVVKHRKPGAPS